MRNFSLGDQAALGKPKRRQSRAGLMFVLVLILITSAAVVALSLFTPIKLAIVQERAIGMIRGGVARVEERTFVDACVRVEGADRPFAVTRIARTTTFGDGSSISVTFNSPPSPTNSQCGG